MFTLKFVVFFTLAFIVTFLLMLMAAYIGTFFIKIYNTIDHTLLKRRLSVCGYQCFYLDYNSMVNDVNSARLLPKLSEVYIKDSKFNPYCKRLSEERLPLNVVMNWSRSIAEDLFSAPIPSVKLDQWNHYWKSKMYTQMTIFHSDFPQYEDYEMGCLWGAAFLWLVICFEKDINDDLMKRMMVLACKEKPAAPYFYHFYNAARESCNEGYYLPQTPNPYYANSMNSTEDKGNYIGREDIFNGFEALSVSERCRARQILNDVLDECHAWKSMCKEMKSRGWFKEAISPIQDTNINIKEYIGGDKVNEKTVIPHVDNYKPQIQSQVVNLSEPTIGEQGN